MPTATFDDSFANIEKFTNWMLLSTFAEKVESKKDQVFSDSELLHLDFGTALADSIAPMKRQVSDTNLESFAIDLLRYDGSVSEEYSSTEKDEVIPVSSEHQQLSQMYNEFSTEKQQSHKRSLEQLLSESETAQVEKPQKTKRCRSTKGGNNDVFRDNEKKSMTEANLRFWYEHLKENPNLRACKGGNTYHPYTPLEAAVLCLFIVKLPEISSRYKTESGRRPHEFYEAVAFFSDEFWVRKMKQPNFKRELTKLRGRIQDYAKFKEGFLKESRSSASNRSHAIPVEDFLTIKEIAKTLQAAIPGIWNEVYSVADAPSTESCSNN